MCWSRLAIKHSGSRENGVKMANNPGVLIDHGQLSGAYAKIIAKGSIQTEFPPPPPPPSPPSEFWLWLEQLAPMIRFLLWVIFAALVLYALYWALRTLAEWNKRHQKNRQAPAPNNERSIGTVGAEIARTLLGQADALAREGRYGEAVHLLLFRSIEDISARCPELIQPALTSRDLAIASEIPPIARTAFSQIARTVEISLFGRREIGVDLWQDCRAAYFDLTLEHHWPKHHRPKHRRTTR